MKQGTKADAKPETRSPGDRLIAGLESVVEALVSGEPLEKRLTVRIVTLDLKPREYRSDDEKAARGRPAVAPPEPASPPGGPSGRLLATKIRPDPAVAQSPGGTPPCGGPAP